MIEIGAIVAAKRSEKGVGQNELARRADMSPSQLCLLEKDRVSPTVRTLERIAEALGISFWDLVAEPPREGAQGGAPRAATRLGDYVALRLGEPWAGKALNDILPREREISSIEDGKGVDSACRLLLKYPKGKLEGSGAVIAGAARASLGIGTAPYCDLAGCLDFNGVRIHKIPLSYQVQSAAYWNTERKTFSIILSAANTPERDLYRLAWELGSICIFSSLGFVPFEETHAYHRFLTDFSAELLMPAVTVQSFSASTGIARNGWTLETVCALKAKFGVSAETFALRLDELGLIDPAVRIGIRDALRAHYVSHPDEMEPAPRLAPLNIASRVQILAGTPRNPSAQPAKETMQ